MHADVNAPIYDMRRARRSPDPGGCLRWTLQGVPSDINDPCPTDRNAGPHLNRMLRVVEIIDQPRTNHHAERLGFLDRALVCPLSVLGIGGSLWGKIGCMSRGRLIIDDHGR
jgi:hypothetical protein